MSISKPSDTILVPTVEAVPRITDAERAELLASLEQGRADIEAGNYDVIGPHTLRREFDAIMKDDLGDDELDELLGIKPQQPR